MNSKEALEKISWRYVNEPSFQEWCNTIKQDLERLEVLERNIENIKNIPNCDICDSEWYKGCMCLKKKLKEVLENEKINEI